MVFAALVLVLCGSVAAESISLGPEGFDEVSSAYQAEKANLQLQWPKLWSMELTCTLPSRAGWQKKEASAAHSPTLKLSPSQAQPYIRNEYPIYRGCQVYISEKWRFIFIRQPKASSSTILQLIRKQLCNGICSPFELRPVHSVDAITWHNYFVFTFVRNPWTRLLSAYHMFNSKHLRKSRVLTAGSPAGMPGEHCGMPFEEYTRNTYGLRRLCQATGCCSYIESGRLWAPHFVDEHISDQSHCVFLPDGRSLTDFIGATETISSDWPQVVNEINRRANTAFATGGPIRKANSGRYSSLCSDDATKQYYNQTTLFNIASQYAVDVMRLGYL